MMPCLNEEGTVAECIVAAQTYISETKIYADILVVDNGSTDKSAECARKAGAVVVSCPDTGYGNALRYGIQSATGKYVIFGDCDCSYDFSRLDGFVKALRSGADVVIGDRFNKNMEKGAMSFSHKYIGVPLLSLIGRLAYRTTVHDFHCGLRGVNKESFIKLGCKCDGMEFSTEMIGRASGSGCHIEEIPVAFHKDKRDKSIHGSHLRSIPDGIRHLKLMLKM